MEANKAHCKTCKQLKNRILDGKFDHVNKRWVDENGWLWSGKICPVCNLERVRNKMREKRNKNVL